jgi:hypothetical protein
VYNSTPPQLNKHSVITDNINITLSSADGVAV